MKEHSLFKYSHIQNVSVFVFAQVRLPPCKWTIEENPIPIDSTLSIFVAKSWDYSQPTCKNNKFQTCTSQTPPTHLLRGDISFLLKVCTLDNRELSHQLSFRHGGVFWNTKPHPGSTDSLPASKPCSPGRHINLWLKYGELPRCLCL